MLYEIIVLILGIPVGFLIAYMCRDELIQGRKWFKIFCVSVFVIGMFCFAIGERTAAWALGFMTIVGFVSYVKSFDSKWMRKD